MFVLSAQSLPQTALIFVLLVAETSTKAVWKWTAVGSGRLSVTTPGTSKKRRWSVVSWGMDMPKWHYRALPLSKDQADNWRGNGPAMEVKPAWMIATALLLNPVILFAPTLGMHLWSALAMVRISACHLLQHMQLCGESSRTPPLVHAALSNGSLRLVGVHGPQFGGWLEIYYNNAWGTVCSDSWNYSDATIACRQMGFLSVGSIDTYRFRYGASLTQHIWLDDVACNGSESRLIDCSHAGIRNDNCVHSEEATILCRNGE